MNYTIIKNAAYKPVKIFIVLTKLVFNFLYGNIIGLYCYRDHRIFICNNMNIGIWQLYKRRTIFPHPIGIVIGLNVKIGNECVIYQNVTIGTKDTENYLKAAYPKIGDNVTIYPNAIIIGDIQIGDNSVIGAGTVVLNDMPPNSVAVGNPSRLI